MDRSLRDAALVAMTSLADGTETLDVLGCWPSRSQAKHDVTRAARAAKCLLGAGARRRCGQDARARARVGRTLDAAGIPWAQLRLARGKLRVLALAQRPATLRVAGWGFRAVSGRLTRALLGTQLSGRGGFRVERLRSGTLVRIGAAAGHCASDDENRGVTDMPAERVRRMEAQLVHAGPGATHMPAEFQRFRSKIAATLGSRDY